MIREHGEDKQEPQKRLPLAELMSLHILRFYLRIPGLPTYEHFLKAANRSFPAIALFMKYLRFLTRQGKLEGP